MSGHQQPDGECIFCVMELNADNYAEFKESESAPWRPSVYCSECIQEYFIDKQWEAYLKKIADADCAAALRRILSKPPPLNVQDKGFASDTNEEGIVHKFWFSNIQKEVSAQLKNTPLGEDRDRFWSDQQENLIALETAEAASSDAVMYAKSQSKQSS